MLMVLPLLAPTIIDYSQEYGIRELFWMGRSNCVIPATHHLTGDILEPHEINTFLCEESQQHWITENGWFELLRQFMHAAYLQPETQPAWEVLWLYVPDYLQQGKMATIINVPRVGNSFDPNDSDPYWRQSDSCSGPIVSDECEWRYEEMKMVTFTPAICVKRELKGCEQLVAYARINDSYGKRMEAIF